MIVARGEFVPARVTTGSANESGADQDAELRNWRPKARRPRATRLSKRPPAEQPSSPPLPRGLDAGPSEIAILDAEGRIVVVNEPWRHGAAGQAPAVQALGVGALYVDVATRLFPDLDRAALQRGVTRLLAGDADDLHLTCPVQTAAGPGWRHLQITPLALGEAGRFVAVHADQTELAATREALTAASEQLFSARDDERRRIAMELHDSTCQHLVVIGFGLARLRRTLPEGGEAVLDEIAQSLEEAIKETRVLSYLMKPRGLGEHGLSTAVQQFLEGFARRTGLEVSLEAGDSIDGAAPSLQHAALRIVQEALLNVSRHAHARRVAVALSVEDGRLVVSIADDGKGMRSGDADPCLGVGIPGMRARAQQFLGDLEISSDQTGTRIVAQLPLN